MDWDTGGRLELLCAERSCCETLSACFVRALAPCVHPAALLRFSGQTKHEQQSVSHFCTPLICLSKRDHVLAAPFPQFFPRSQKELPLGKVAFREAPALPAPHLLPPVLRPSPTCFALLARLQPPASWSLVLLWGVGCSLSAPTWVGFSFLIT